MSAKEKTQGVYTWEQDKNTPQLSFHIWLKPSHQVWTCAMFLSEKDRDRCWQCVGRAYALIVYLDTWPSEIVWWWSFGQRRNWGWETFFFFLINFYRSLLLSVKAQHESDLSIHISPLSWTSLPSPSPAQPSRLTQSPCLSFLSHAANFRWLSISHIVMQVSMLLSHMRLRNFKYFVSSPAHLMVQEQSVLSKWETEAVSHGQNG